MARVNHVKAYRGQRKCQFVVGDPSIWGPAICGEPKKAHGGITVPVWPLGHAFLQAPLSCDFCDEPINVGDAYKYIKTRAHRAEAGVKRDRHEHHPGWKPSETTSSTYLQQIFGASEAAEVDLATVKMPAEPGDADSYLEDLRAIAAAAAETFIDVAEQYEESSSNIEEGFGHPTYQSEELSERADEVRAWGDELEYITLDEFYDDEEVDKEERVDALADWAEEQRSAVSDAMAEVG